MGIQHVFSNLIADGTNTQIVRPSDWNSAHNNFITLAGNTAGVSTVSGTNIVFAGAPNLTLSGAQGANEATISFSGGAGAAGNTGYVSAGTTNASLGTLNFANSNGVSFGVDGQTITATVKTDYLTTAMASNRGSDFVQATAVFHGTNASGTIASNAISVSVAAQSAQPVAASAANGSAAFSTLSFSNANGISFSTAAGPAIVASHNGLTSQSNQAFSAQGGSSAFQTLSFNNANGATFLNNAGAVELSYTRPVVSNAIQAVGTATGSGTNTSRFAADDHVHEGIYSVGVSNDAGNTIGDTRVGPGRYIFRGGPNITLSQITAANGLNTIVVSGGAGAAGNTGYLSAGTTNASLGTVSFADSNGVSFGVNGQTITGSVATSLTNIRVSAGTTSNLLSAVTFADGNGISFGLNASTLTASHNALTSQSNQALSGSNGSFAFQTATFGNLNGLSFYTSNGSLVGSYTVPTVTNSSMTVSDAATSGTLARLAFTNLNGVTLSLSTGAAGSHTIVGSHNALTSQSNQNITAANGGFAFQTLSFSNANGVSFGTSAGSAVTASHNGLTTARASNDGVGLNTAQSNVTWTVNSSGLSLDARGYAGTGTTFAGANVSGSITLNSAGINLSLSGATAAPSPVNVSAGTTSNNLATVVFSNSNGVSFGLNGSTITASVNAGGGGGVGAGVSNLGNTAGSTGTVSTGNFVLVGSNGITLSQSTEAAGSAATITINGYPPLSEWVPRERGIPTTATNQHANQWVSIAPFTLPKDVAFSNVLIGASFNPATAANSSSAFINVSISGVIYTRNSTALSSVVSFSNTLTNTWSSNATGTVVGLKAMSITFGGTTLTPGVYYLAVHCSTNNTATGGAATTALGHSLSMLIQSTAVSAINAIKDWAGNTAVTRGLGSGQGILSTNATRASIAFSDYTHTGASYSFAAVYFNLRNETWNPL